MSEQDTVALDYAFHGVVPDGWFIHPLTGKPIKHQGSIAEFKSSRNAISKENAAFARKVNAYFETKTNK
jgi:hypothetical protein